MKISGKSISIFTVFLTFILGLSFVWFLKENPCIENSLVSKITPSLRYRREILTNTECRVEGNSRGLRFYVPSGNKTDPGMLRNSYVYEGIEMNFANDADALQSYNEEINNSLEVLAREEIYSDRYREQGERVLITHRFGSSMLFKPHNQNYYRVVDAPSAKEVLIYEQTNQEPVMPEQSLISDNN